MADKKILIIDDEPSICEFVKKFLEQKGFGVVACMRGQDGLLKAREMCPDLVLLDLNLPDIYGIEILNEIKNINKDIQVIVLTGYATSESVIEAIKLGAYEQIAKPIDLKKLFTVIKAALNIKGEGQGKTFKKILIIDDEPDLLRSLGIRLKSAGYEVWTASTGLEGIEQLKQEKPDLIVVDIMMPGLSGLETIKEIKAIDASLPVIVLTAYGTPTSAIESLKLGAYDHLAKPFNTQTLLDLVDKAISSR